MIKDINVVVGQISLVKFQTRIYNYKTLNHYLIVKLSLKIIGNPYEETCRNVIAIIMHFTQSCIYVCQICHTMCSKASICTNKFQVNKNP